MLMSKYNFSPICIFNLDETEITTVNRPSRIVAPKGQKQIGAATSGERGKNITVCCCMNASGAFTSPLFIYPRKSMHPALEKGGPPDSAYKCTKSRWISEELFFFWLQHFSKIHNPSKKSPVLLILDNHSSHTSLQIYNYCKSNGIILLSIPPHTSHRLQPLDLSFFSSLKKAYDIECDLFLKSRPFEKITVLDVNELFTKAYIKTANAKKAINGFKKAGIVPLNPSVFDEADFYDTENNAESHTNPHNNSTPEAVAIVTHSLTSEQPTAASDLSFSSSFSSVTPLPKKPQRAKEMEDRK